LLPDPACQLTHRVGVGPRCLRPLGGRAIFEQPHRANQFITLWDLVHKPPLPWRKLLPPWLHCSPLPRDVWVEELCTILAGGCHARGYPVARDSSDLCPVVARHHARVFPEHHVVGNKGEHPEPLWRAEPTATLRGMPA
jgi:hypothetical protein